VPDVEPVETTKDLAREAAEGSSERTPLIALGAVHLIVGIVVAVLIALVFLVYALA
jgi:hypothetical protein